MRMSLVHGKDACNISLKNSEIFPKNYKVDFDQWDSPEENLILPKISCMCWFRIVKFVVSITTVYLFKKVDEKLHRMVRIRG